jgi:hypothetical protein
LTEVEYVQAIRDAALAYLEVIRNPTAYLDDGAKRMRRWWTIREKLSAHTAVRLCDAWLAQSHIEAPGRAEQQAEGKE